MFFESPSALWLLMLAAVPGWLIARTRGEDRSRNRRRLYLRAALLCMTVAACAIAVAGPRRQLPGREALEAGTDAVIVLDVSMSMLANDVHPSRLAEATRQLVERFTADGAPRRIGVVLFGGDARVACPLTADRAAVRQALESASEDGAAAGGSNIGAGLTRALAMLSGDRQSAMVVLVSDGEQGPGAEPEPADIGRRLAARDIHTIVVGIGSAEGATIPVRGAAGGVVATEADGRARLSRVNEERLRAIAAAAGGDYEAVAADRQLLFAFPAAIPPTTAGKGPFGPLLWHGIPLAAAVIALTLDTMLWWFGGPRENGW